MIPVDIPLWADLLASLLMITGGALTLIGSLGLLRLPDLFARIHGPTLNNSLGLGSVLLASILIASIQADRLVFQEVLITLFVVATAPVTAMLLMRAGMYRRRADGGKKKAPQPDEST
ncbi:monovalent cation/H(+) antiporter subunit G [Nitrosovibrio sp. Nv6]|uniref:monovalent cation/H(+) antiporter subunit G n=1 Tax=Nitrosovibrio sp. Nv6 TaxID=1855340 RepID=UPI0008CC047A|nr:monovalent cation/H(+) antiporter subunit G [Nitrosovibrio sp. Nv6]SEO60782.1 multicomponent K+:H+ antiporter subunit G [Nitrosovibrio sp. Nv6]